MNLNSFIIFLDKVDFFDHFTKFFPNTSLAIVMYHNIGNNEISWLLEKPFPCSTFEMQIKYLKKARYSILPLGEALTLIHKDQSPKRIAVLTFDDGYNGVYKYAFPIMRKHDIKCTVYVSSSFVKHKTIPWCEQVAFIIDSLHVPVKLDLAPFKALIIGSKNDKIRIQRNIIQNLYNKDIESITLYINKLVNASGIDVSDVLKSPIMLNHDEVMEMIEYGVEIGGHGTYHVGLPTLTPNRLNDELYESYKFASEYNRSHFMTFAYPFGAYNETVIEGLKKAGFNAAVTMEASVNNIKSLNLYKLRRIPPCEFDQGMMASFKYNLIRPKKLGWIQSLLS